MQNSYEKIIDLRLIKQDIKFCKRVISNLDIGEENNEIDEDINEIKSSINNIKSHLEECINKEILKAYELISNRYKEQTHFEFCIGPDVAAEIKLSEYYKSVKKILKPVIKIFDINTGIYSDRFPSSKIGYNVVYSRCVYFDFDLDESFQNITVTIKVSERLLQWDARKIADKEIYKTLIKIN